MMFLSTDQSKTGIRWETNSDDEFYPTGQPHSKQKSGGGWGAPTPHEQEV